ncbi:MAG: DUF2497 domain-containing protein [Alphaproteobacteria bacterium]|nr:DUF2497 domain-containing protein [Alphaproteobacteria bacterium]
MTDVQDASATAEPSMEEILASIRRIIADEKEPEAAESASEPVEEPKEDVLELTQLVQDDGTIASVNEEPNAIEFDPVPVPDPDLVMTEASEPAPEPVSALAEPMVKEEADALLSDLAESAAASSLAALASTVHIEKKASFAGFTPLGNGDKTLEAIIMEMMRPMLKEWLDQNLPPVVERLVQKEVERIARRVQE